MIKAPLITSETIVTNHVVDIITYKKFLWKGRYDNVVNSGGIKLFPEVIERKLSKIIDQRIFVIGVPDDSLGQKLILFVEAEFSEELLAQLQEKVKNLKSLDKYEIPKKIYLIEKLKKHPTVKFIEKIPCEVK